MGCDHVFDFTREDIEAPGDDHVLFAIDDVQEPVVVVPTHIAGMKPSAGKRFSRLFGHLVVAFHHERRSHADFARLAFGRRLVVGVEKRDVDPGARAAAGRKALGFG